MVAQCRRRHQALQFSPEICGLSRAPWRGGSARKGRIDSIERFLERSGVRAAFAANELPLAPAQAPGKTNPVPNRIGQMCRAVAAGDRTT